MNEISYPKVSAKLLGLAIKGYERLPKEQARWLSEELRAIIAEIGNDISPDEA